MKQLQEPDLGIKSLFEPQSVAIIGSFKENTPGGYTIMQQLLEFGFEGKVYPINPSYNTALGRRVYPSITQVPELVDIAIVMTSCRVVPSILRECAEKGVKAAIIVADGFAERDKAGAMLQEEIVDIACHSGMRLLGPNTIGVANPAIGLVLNPYELGYRKIVAGSVALCSQTGILGAQALPLENKHYGISKICDCGNKCDIDEVDLLTYLGEDPQTNVIAMHLEDIKDGHSFLNKAREVASRKPVLILKPGRTKESAKAVASHTGSLAGEDQIYDAAFKQAGIIRVNSIGELLDFAKVLALQPLPSGNRVAFITTTGGGGIVGIDTAVQWGLTPAEFSRQTLEKLAQIFPFLTGNPVDIGPAFPLVWDTPESLYEKVTRAVIEDENVDSIVVVLWSRLPLSLIEIFRQLKEHTSKPITIWLYGTELRDIAEWSYHMEEVGIPTYHEFDTAVKALGVLFQYSKIKASFSV